MKFNMAAVRHFGFGGGSHGITHEDPFMVAVICENFIMIGVVV